MSGRSDASIEIDQPNQLSGTLSKKLLGLPIVTQRSHFNACSTRGAGDRTITLQGRWIRKCDESLPYAPSKTPTHPKAVNYRTPFGGNAIGLTDTARISVWVVVSIQFWLSIFRGSCLGVRYRLETQVGPVRRLDCAGCVRWRFPLPQGLQPFFIRCWV